MASGEYSFLTDVPNAHESHAPDNLCFVAEDVLEGVRIAVNTVNASVPTNEQMTSRRRLELAAHNFLKWLESLPKINCYPFVEAAEPLETYRLGRLLDGQYALYEGPAVLAPSYKYPINYVCGHSPPHDRLKYDVLQGMENQKQLYLGYAPPSISDMDGYAISLNRLLVLEAQQAIHLDAEPSPDIKLPYYRGFPDVIGMQERAIKEFEL